MENSVKIVKFDKILIIFGKILLFFFCLEIVSDELKVFNHEFTDRNLVGFFVTAIQQEQGWAFEK